jgi:hypothetical protein
VYAGNKQSDEKLLPEHRERVMDSNIIAPLELLDKVINLGHVSREFYCERCKAFTKQVIVSYAENLDLLPLKGDSFLTKRFKGIFGHAMDYFCWSSFPRGQSVCVYYLQMHEVRGWHSQ